MTRKSATAELTAQLKRSKADATDARPAAKTQPQSSIGPTMTLADLMMLEIPEPQFLIGGLLPLGLSVLAARPKSGKSWLALLWSIALANGGRLGGFESRRVPVLYLALEDTRRRFRDRAGKVLAATGFKANANLNVRVDCPRAGAGGLKLVADWFSRNAGGLVIVDTLAKFRDRADGGSAYEADYAAVADLKGLADEHGGAALLIHHTRKGGAEDPFDEVSGTLGITGAADSTFVLERNRGESSASLFVTGRDIAEQTFALKWNAPSCLWEIAAPADGITRIEKPQPATRVELCAKWLRAFIGDYSWPDVEIIEAAWGEGFNEDNVRRAKGMMRNEDPPLHSKPRGTGGAWWNWIGDRSSPSPDRPAPGGVDVAHKTHKTHKTGGDDDGSEAPQVVSHTLFMHESNNTADAGQSCESCESCEPVSEGTYLIGVARALGATFSLGVGGVTWTGGKISNDFASKLHQNREAIAVALASEKTP